MTPLEEKRDDFVEADSAFFLQSWVDPESVLITKITD
jgi:hypothetical protein